MTPVVLLLALAAGVAGALLRFAAIHLTRRTRFPWATLVVNAVGSFIAGLAVTAVLGTEVGVVVTSGFCGGLTTYSTFAVDSVRLWRSARGRAAFGNVLASLALGIGAAALGVGIGLTFG